MTRYEELIEKSTEAPYDMTDEETQELQQLQQLQHDLLWTPPTEFKTSTIGGGVKTETIKIPF